MDVNSSHLCDVPFSGVYCKNFQWCTKRDFVVSRIYFLVDNGQLPNKVEPP